MRVHGETDVGRIAAELDRERGFRDQVAGIRADNTCADDLPGLFREQELGQPLGAPERE
jgi:hypothetical protein